MNRPEPLLAPLRTGPLPRIQWCVEFVGPRSVNATNAHRLIDPDWRTALGSPECWAMAARDDRWQPLAGHPGSSFDSLALTWDLVTDRGELTPTAASTLLARATEFAAAIGRRAFSLWPADETDSRVAAVKRLAERLDGGFAITVAFPRPVEEANILRILEDEGFDTPDSDGGRSWARPGRPPFLNATPTEEPYAFGFGTPVAGVTFGVRLPLCAIPLEAFDVAVAVSVRLRELHGGVLFDDEGGPLEPGRTRQAIAAIVEAMEAAHLEPGGAECLRLFR